MYLPDIISIGFIVLSVVYLICAFVILSFGIHEIKHRLLFYSFICFAWWAFAFAIANNATDVRCAILWRRMASLGWGTVFSFLLHYTLVLTESKLPLKKGLIHLIIYLPAVLNVFLYGIIDTTALVVYQMQKTKTGWTNVAELSALNIPHFISNLVFTLLMVGLLINWGMKTDQMVKKKTGLVTGITALFSIITGLLTEYAIKTFFDISFPQLGPLSFIFTAFILFFCSRKSGLIFKVPKDMTPAENQIFSNYALDRLFLYLALGAIVGGFIVFVDLFFVRRITLWVSITISGALLLTAVTIYLTRRLRVKAETKELIVGLVLSLSLIGFAVFVHRWPISLSLLLHSLYTIAAIIFANKKLMISIATAVFISLVISWIRYPVVEVTFTSIDHGVRMAIMIVMFCFIMIINYFLKKAIISSQEKIKREKFLSDMATLLMTTDEENFDVNIKKISEMWGVHLGADCINVTFIDDNSVKIKSECHWSKDATVESFTLRHKEKDSLIVELKRLRYIWDKDNEDSHNDNDMFENETTKLLKEKINSGNLTILPLKNIEQLIGIVVIEKITSTLVWQEEQHRTNHIAARMLSDVWIRIESFKMMRYDSLYDKLTALPNRQYFSERVKHAINMASRTDKLIGICFIDFDSFKLINDTMGHNVGDEFLRQVARRIKENVREYDVSARFGGDEFLLMIPQADDISSIENVAMRVLNSIKKPVIIDEQILSVSASMGISVYPYDGNNYDDLLKNADIALYISKGNGSGKHIFCSDDIRKEAYINNTLLSDLNFALENNEMFLVYQPVVQASNERIIGVEALLRWKHRKLGMISPQIFIPLAEKRGLMGKIGSWVIYEACMQNKKWLINGLEPVTMAINISLVQFLDGNLVEIVHDALRKAELSPELIELELTESISIHSSQNFTQKIDLLKRLGVRIAIDDFGSGFSSFGRLKSMQVDKIKIDMQFVRGIGYSKMDEEIVKAITQMGKTLNLKILAEGVEEMHQLEFLKENSCDEIQGYYFYKPVDASVIEKTLRKQAGELATDI